jgi:DNA-binding beta-propeller fold protein YncE
MTGALPRFPRVLLVALLISALALLDLAAAPLHPAPSVPPARLLPTGRALDPAGRSSDLGNMPLAMVAAPGGERVVVLLNGWREQGLQVVEIATGRVVQSVPQPAAFFGLVFASDGRNLYVSGGNDDVVVRYAWSGGMATPAGRIDLSLGAPAGGPPATGAGGGPVISGVVVQDAASARHAGKRFPAGLALSPDGKSLYVAENLADALAVVDLASGTVKQRLATDPFPYGVVAAPDGTVFVSSWGGSTVSVYEAKGADGGLAATARIIVGRRPSALLLNAAASRLFVASASTDRVAVIDTRSREVLANLFDAPPAGPPEGSTPNALALAANGRRLFVAEADSNAVAVFELSASIAGLAGGGAGRVGASLAGRIPVGWYPTALLLAGDRLLVANGKGRGTGPNPALPQPGSGAPRPPASYTLGQTSGTLTVLPARLAPAELARLSRRVASANGWDRPRPGAPGGRPQAAYPPFAHVVYIIKENRTYDQVFGDLGEGDGDPSLVFFPRAVAPNHHALAEHFGLYDRFFTNAEVSTQGHSWSTAAYVTDYVEKTTPSGYSNRRPELEEGSEPDDPAAGFLWDLARAKGLTVRDYGEFAQLDKAPRGAREQAPQGAPEQPPQGAPEQAPQGAPDKTAAGATSPPPPPPPRYTSIYPSLAPLTNPDYPGWDLAIPDQRRADVWLAELAEYVRRGEMPALEIVWLPNDHTSGASAGAPTPRAMVADNDLALGRMIAALSRTPFWKSTVVFVLEDDAQAGPDHVDSHRAPFLVLSPYNRPGVMHRFVNTTDVVGTIEQLLGLATLSQYDTYSRPLADVFAATPDLTPYSLLTPQQPLDEKNPAGTKAAQDSLGLDLGRADAADEALFNRILWQALKGGDSPYPGAARLSTLDLQRTF